MIKLKNLGLAALIGMVGSGVAIVGCNSGSTDGGSTASGIGNPITSKTNAKLSISITGGNKLTVGETRGFRVKLRDPSDKPLKYIRVFCDSEKGVSILEPSAGGVAFESTDGNGEISGVIGGLTKGSFLMECRAEQGFNLVDRADVIITGDSPQDFQGFPGAAGGNMGGGLLVDETPNIPDDGENAIRVTAFKFIDAGATTTGTGSDFLGPLDVTQNNCCEDVTTTTTTSTTTPVRPTTEPFIFTSYNITIKNDSNERVFITSVKLTFQLNGSSTDADTPTLGQVVVIDPGSSGTLSGIVTTEAGCLSSANSDICLVGETSPLSPGSYAVTADIAGETSNATPVEITKQVAVQFDQVNNCPAGTLNVGSATSCS
jgi:hypothetical protein